MLVVSVAYIGRAGTGDQSGVSNEYAIQWASMVAALIGVLDRCSDWLSLTSVNTPSHIDHISG